jgi:hypothetical protein
VEGLAKGEVLVVDLVVVEAVDLVEVAALGLVVVLVPAVELDLVVDTRDKY